VSEPTLLLVIDEINQVMENAGIRREVQPKLIDLCQSGRKFGVHVWLGSQKPSGELISPHILSNIPVRVYGHLADRKAAKSICAPIEAESLSGNGDMLVCMKGEAMRLQACYMPKTEIAEKVAALRCKYATSARRGEDKGKLVQFPFDIPGERRSRQRSGYAASSPAIRESHGGNGIEEVKAIRASSQILPLRCPVPLAGAASRQESLREAAGSSCVAGNIYVAGNSCVTGSAYAAENSADLDDMDREGSSNSFVTVTGSSYVTGSDPYDADDCAEPDDGDSCASGPGASVLPGRIQSMLDGGVPFKSIEEQMRATQSGKLELALWMEEHVKEQLNEGKKKSEIASQLGVDKMKIGRIAQKLGI
jgi:hypothetical protein